MKENSALHGIRVIDFGQYIAGPVTAMLLGDFGADVIRVDPPGGPRFNTPANATWNRGKRSIVLDLKTAADLAVAKKLISTADVVIENFRPGVMARLGLGAKAMTAANPKLIYCSIPGFASNDPRAGMRAWEGVVAAATGCYSNHPTLKNWTRPVYTAIPYSSMFGASLAAVSIAAALNARKRTGLGQTIEVPLFNATFSAFSGKLMKVHGEPEVDQAARWNHVQCKDGRWFMYLPARLNKHLLEFPEMAEWRGKDLSSTEVTKRTTALFLTRTSSEWEEFCARLGLEGITHHTSAEWLRHPLAETTGIVSDFYDPEIGQFRGFNINPRLSATPGKVSRSRAELNEHRMEILKELDSFESPATSGESDEQLQSALQGVRVLDLGIILASPVCGRTLAEFGADVIKVDSPHRNPVNWHNDVNRAKRMILLDLKQPEGLEVFWKLVRDADVLVENFRLGIADKLGIGYKEVSERRPQIVYCSVNAFGRQGTYSKRPGREVLAQAISGVTLRLGSKDEPIFNGFNANDYCTGLMCAFGIMLALLVRDKTGSGQFVHSALIYGATLLQSNMMQDFEGKDWTVPNGQACLGTHALYRAYKASDDWIFLAAKDCGLSGCPELADLAKLLGRDLEAALERRISTRNAEDWIAVLRRAGLAAERVVLKLTNLIEDPIARAQGLVVTREHDVLGLVTTAGPGIKLSGTPVRLGRPAPKPGADAKEILTEIAMEDELEQLLSHRVVVTEGIEAGGAS